MERGSALQSTSAQVSDGKSVQERVLVNLGVCRKVAGLARRKSVPADKEEDSPSWMSRSEIGNFYFFLVAICHQTSPRGKPPLEGDVNGRHLRGWDYLSARLESAVRQDSELFSPAVWSHMTTERLLGIFRDPICGDRLSDPEGRALLVQDLGRKMAQYSWSCVDQLYEAANGRITGRKANLIELLGQFRAYEDPVKKKSFFFLALMHNTGLWNYADPDHLGAPVDYHEIRGHLRLGTVEIKDPVLYAKLVAGSEVSAEEDISIRSAVLQALMYISECSGLRNPSQLHYLFWNIFRSCCSRENTHCYSCPPNCSLPERYVPLTLSADGHRQCAFSTVCRSAGREPKLIEHHFETDYY